MEGYFAGVERESCIVGFSVVAPLAVKSNTPQQSYGAWHSFSLASSPQGAGYLTRAQSPSASKLAFGSLHTRE